MSQAPPATQFWLMPGDTPAGPFTVQQVHAELASGRVTWRTPACLVGGSQWQPLLETPGVGPAARSQGATELPVAISDASGPSLPIPILVPPRATLAPSPATPPSSFERFKAEMLGWFRSGEPSARAFKATGVVLALAFCAYCLFQWARPLSAKEVCERFGVCKSATDAKSYVTARMYPVVDAFFAEGDADPNIEASFTDEVEGPQPGTKRVGFRLQGFMQEAGGRVGLEGYFALVSTGGWRIDDIVISGLDGASMPGPASMVEAYAPAPTSRLGGSVGDDWISRNRMPGLKLGSGKPQKGWSEALNPVKNRWVGMAIVAVVAGVIRSVRSQRSAVSRVTPSPDALKTHEPSIGHE